MSGRSMVLAAFVLLLTSAPAPVQAQTEHPNPIDEVLQFFNAPGNQQWTSWFLKDTVPGKTQGDDPVDDFARSGGDEPGDIAGRPATRYGEFGVDLYTAPVAFTFQGSAFDGEASFSMVDDEFRWFTTCR